ncbi:MAG: divergent polysaccharide deacetylase family protein [Dongiaceae bacterium]
MSEISQEARTQSKSQAARWRTPRWLLEAGHVALHEVAGLGVLALIIASAFGWFWSNPLDLDSEGDENPALASLPAAESAALADFARADPVDLSAIAPGAGQQEAPAPAAGGGADIGAQVPMPQWRRNAVTSPAADGRYRIAVIIDDLGVSPAAFDRVAALPAPLTLAIMNYAADAPKLAQAARKAGHEVLVHVPMEPEGNLDPGPHALTTEQTREAFEQQLAWGLDRFEGYVGINNHMGSRVTASTERMSWLFEELERRGLMFVDSRTTKETVAPMLAESFNLPFAERDVFLDNEFGADAVEAQLKVLESEARTYGYAVAIGHPHAGTIAALKTWLPTLADRGYVLVPISNIAVQRNQMTTLSLNN